MIVRFQVVVCREGSSHHDIETIELIFHPHDFPLPKTPALPTAPPSLGQAVLASDHLSGTIV